MCPAVFTFSLMYLFFCLFSVRFYRFFLTCSPVGFGGAPLIRDNEYPVASHHLLRAVIACGVGALTVELLAAISWC